MKGTRKNHEARRRQQLNARSTARDTRMKHPGGKSHYAQKILAKGRTYGQPAVAPTQTAPLPPPSRSTYASSYEQSIQDARQRLAFMRAVGY